MDRHASHFSFAQALAFFALFDPPPSLGLLTDFTHRIEHHKTQELVDEWRNGMNASQQGVLANGRQTMSTNGSDVLGRERWWQSIWDERANERDMTIKLKRSFGQSLDEEAARRVPHYVPPILLAWDGMVVPFRRS